MIATELMVPTSVEGRKSWSPPATTTETSRVTDPASQVMIKGENISNPEAEEPEEAGKAPSEQ